MTQQRERQVLIGVLATSLVLCAALFALAFTAAENSIPWEPFFMLFLGTACQCAIRLVLTGKPFYDHDRLFVTTRGWFQKNWLDKSLAGKEKVRRWADLQAFDPENFRVTPQERELINQHTCTYELMNEINAVAAFLPLLLALPADDKVPAVILLAVLSAVFCALALSRAIRARQFRFNIKAGRY